MLLAIATNHSPATDLGYLLHLKKFGSVVAPQLQFGAACRRKEYSFRRTALRKHDTGGFIRLPKLSDVDR